MNTPKCTHQHALTIIELLVVIGILAILIALIVPAVQGMNDRMNAVNCQANMRTLYSALQAYRLDHSGYLPPGELVYRDTLGFGDDFEAMIKKELIGENYLNDKKDFIPAGYLSEMPVCPAMRLQKTDEAAKRYPDQKKRLKQLGSYGVNAYLCSVKMDGMPGSFWKHHKWPYPGDSKMVMLVESTSIGAANSWFGPKSALNGYDVGIRMIAPRHHGNNRLNFMFLDGHMELIAPKALPGGEWDWSEHFNEGGTDGKYIQPRQESKPSTE